MVATSDAVPVIVVEATVTTPVVAVFTVFRSDAADDAPETDTASSPRPSIPSAAPCAA